MNGELTDVVNDEANSTESDEFTFLMPLMKFFKRRLAYFENGLSSVAKHF